MLSGTKSWYAIVLPVVLDHPVILQKAATTVGASTSPIRQANVECHIVESRASSVERRLRQIHLRHDLTQRDGLRARKPTGRYRPLSQPKALKLAPVALTDVAQGMQEADPACVTNPRRTNGEKMCTNAGIFTF